MRLCVGLLLAVMSLQGQEAELFLANGYGAPDDATVEAFSLNPVARVATIPVQTRSRFFFRHRDGSRYYSISLAGPDGILVLSSVAPYSVLKRLPVESTVAAAMAPDGKKLVLVGYSVTTGNSQVTVLDLDTDLVVAQMAFAGELGHFLDIALDSSRVFFARQGVPGELYAMDLNTYAMGPRSLRIGFPRSLKVGPNGLVYVGFDNGMLLEVDGRTMTPWGAISGGTAAVSDFDFSADGAYVLSTAGLFNLNTRKLTTYPGTGWVGEQIVMALGPRRGLVGRVEVDWTDGAVDTITTKPLPNDFDRSIAFRTAEFPAPRFVFTLDASGLRRYAATGLFSTQVAVPVSKFRLNFQPRPGTGAISQLVAFQMEQTVRRSDTPKPMVVRAIDTDGKPLADVDVTFQSTIFSGTARTDTKGNAVLPLPAGNPPGQYVVSATASGMAPATFRLTVVEDPSGVVGLTVVSGDLDYTYPSASSSIVVRLRGPQGTVRPREAVTFRVRSGIGTLTVASAGACSAAMCTVWTDEDGLATIAYLPASRESYPDLPSVERIDISSGAANVTISRTVTPVDGSVVVETLSPAGGTYSGVAGSVIPGGYRGRVWSVDTLGNRRPLPSVRLFIQNRHSSPASIWCEATTDADGFAACPLQLPMITGRWTPFFYLGAVEFGRLQGSLTVTSFPNRPEVVLNAEARGADEFERTLEISAFRAGTETPQAILNVLVNSALDGGRACYVAYSVAAQALYLVDDAGPEAGLTGPLVLGGSGTVSNGQCTVFGTGSSFAGTSSRPVLRLRIRFAASFGGPRIVYLASRTANDAENSGWQSATVLHLPRATNPVGPRVEPLTPTARLSSGETFDFEFRDASGGAAGLQTVWGLIGSSIDAGTGCIFAYYVPGHLAILYPDNGLPTGALTPVTQPTFFENSRCLLMISQAEATPTGLRLQVSVGAKVTFGGAKTAWGAASTLQNAVSPWTPLATWKTEAPFP
jgi:hypothetical protein